MHAMPIRIMTTIKAQTPAIVKTEASLPEPGQCK